ncbi:MAG: uracil-xanthine permease [Ruminococcaceae bacterium]|nr:uracil-xanthine permease [Oscillospiraceae bacterium]
MKLIYDIKDKPKFGQTLVFAIQQLLAIMAATLVVPVIIGNDMSSVAALFGAGIGTLVYLCFTKFKSPVFLGSSFAFIGSMFSAFGGAASMAAGYMGLILGAVFAGLVYVIIALIIKVAGVNWLNKLMPPVVIGPTVAIIGLSLAGNAIGDLQNGDITTPVTTVTQTLANGMFSAPEIETSYVSVASPLLCVFCGIVTLFVTVFASTYGKKMIRLIPFIIGILAGYAVAAVFTIIGTIADNPAFMIIDFGFFKALVEGGVGLKTFIEVPDFTFITAFKGLKDITAEYIVTLIAAYVPVAFVVFAEHVADHKNISSIIEKDLLEDPGLDRTLLGDGVGSMAGAFFGGCPNTTYGESVACVAITRNASVVTIFTTAIMALAISFFSPFVAFVNSIPACVMGGVCIALYGFIAVSGLKMVQKVDLEQNKNLFVVATILICGIGGLTLNFALGKNTITITAIACALILGIIVNIMLSDKEEPKAEAEAEVEPEAVAEPEAEAETEDKAE